MVKNYCSRFGVFVQVGSSVLITSSCLVQKFVCMKKCKNFVKYLYHHVLNSTLEHDDESTLPKFS